MATLSQLDLDVRLQLSGIRYCELISIYVDSLRFGKKCVVDEQYKLFILNNYIELLSTYNIDTCDTISPNNCLTESEAQLICDNISEMFDICFQPIGFEYIGEEKQGGIGKMIIGCDFIVS